MKISAAIERQSALEQAPPRAEFPDYVRALQRIALGQDPTGTARDRLSAERSPASRSDHR
ncbi:MAG: hypothetical protein M3R39_02120 [Actinomycetota bacterium]|nr:hypothetical protein [Actinomycetota bacterium]